MPTNKDESKTELEEAIVLKIEEIRGSSLSSQLKKSNAPATNNAGSRKPSLDDYDRR